MKKVFRRPAVVAATLALCVCLSGVTVLAATGALEGYFKDIIGRQQAIVGTSYEQATEEIDVHIAEAGEKLLLEIELLMPDKVPYSEFESFGVKSYEIFDAATNLVAKGDNTAAAEIIEGKVSVAIPLDGVPGGEYKLVISEMVGEKKADQPLAVRGTWECEFSK